MSALAFATLTCWPLALIVLFWVLRPTRAVVWGYVLGWAFLPLIEINIPGLPAYGKFTATSLCLVPLILIFDGRRLLHFNPRWIDLPAIAWCVAPLLSSLSNNLGIYDGISGLNRHAVYYAIPYFVGRLYLGSTDGWHQFGKALVITAAAYVPLCLFEMRMSPCLHLLVYGESGRVNNEYSGLFGSFGWQPTVFMNSAFEVNMLMVIASLVTFWTWYIHGPRQIPYIDVRFLVCLFLTQSILCKKWSALGLLCLGILFMIAARYLKSAVIPWIFAIAPVVYMVSFSTGAYRGEGISERIAQYSERRAESFQFRLDNDSRLVNKAMERPYFGWGGWGRNRITDDEGRDTSITDSAYGIQLGVMGSFGLVAATLMSLLPFLYFVSRCPPGKWGGGAAMYAVPLAIVACLHEYDNLFNAFPSWIYPSISGGVATTALWACGRSYDRSMRRGV